MPDNDHTYDYSLFPVTEIGGYPFHQNASFIRVPDAEPRPDSDGARARQFLRQRGLELGRDVLWQRLVWLIDEPARNELMIIYMEDLGEHGLILEDLQPGGGAFDQREQIATALLERAKAGIVLRER